MPSTVVVGGFFGDEGKGKIISYLSKKDNPSIVVRGGAGPNAGHTIKDGNTTYKVRMLPSGFLNKDAKVMIGPGVVVNPDIFFKEIQEYGVSGRAFLDKHCGIIEQNHLDQDSKGRLKEKIGSTGSGTGPANAERAMRTLKMAKDIESLSSYIIDVPDEVYSALKDQKNVLIEGTQGTHLSLWHGTYPFVTSSSPTTAGAALGSGIAPSKISDVVGVTKAYLTRVGSGPFPTELEDEVGEIIREKGQEFGTTTGRPRRCGWLDLVMLELSNRICGFTSLAITKLDILSDMDEIKVCVAYKGKDGTEVNHFPSSLSYLGKCTPVYKTFAGWSSKEIDISNGIIPKEMKNFLDFVSESLNIPISIVSLGPGRDETIIF